MTLEELLEQARPIARRAAELQLAMSKEYERIKLLIDQQRDCAATARARGEIAPEADSGFFTGLVALAGLEVGGLDPEKAANIVAAALDLRAAHEKPRSLVLPAPRRIELMLLQRLAAQTEGN